MGEPWVRVKVGHEKPSDWFRVPTAKDVATFKENIKRKKPIALAHCDADCLTVYKAAPGG